MSLFKFTTIGTVLQTINNPRVQSAVDVKDGYVFNIVDGSTYKEQATAFTADADAEKGNLYVAMNIIDTPELWRQSDFVIKAGSYIRSFRLDTLVGATVEMSSDLCITAFAGVNVGDVLVPAHSTDATPMAWKLQGASTTYAIGLKVLEKTTFGGTGFYCKIVQTAVKGA